MPKPGNGLQMPMGVFSVRMGQALEAAGGLFEATLRLEEDLDRIVDDMIAAYTDAIPSYAQATGDFLDDIRAGAAETVLGALAAVRDELPSGSLTGPLADLGRRRAGQAIPLLDVLQAFQIGARIILDELAVATPAAHRDSVIAGATFTVLDVLQNATTAVSAGYVEVARQQAADEEYEVQLLLEVLVGMRVADSRHAERVRRHGLDVSLLGVCSVTAPPEAQVAATVRRLREHFPKGVVGRLDEFVVAYGDSPLPESFEHLPPTGYAIAPVDAGRSFRRARAAWRAAVHLDRRFVRYADVVPLAMLLDASEDDRDTFVSVRLGPLLDDPRGDDLIHTLAMYYRHNQAVAATSRALHLHRHSLEYRLERISALLEADLRDPETRLLLEMALLLAPGTDSLGGSVNLPSEPERANGKTGREGPP